MGAFLLPSPSKIKLNYFFVRSKAKNSFKRVKNGAFSLFCLLGKGGEYSLPSGYATACVCEVG